MMAQRLQGREQAAFGAQEPIGVADDEGVGESLGPGAEHEVEGVLGQHPAVRDVAVIGVPHEKWGEAVTALIVARPGTRPAAEALMQHVRDRKGGTYTPKQIEFVEALPLTAVGKVDKKVLRAKHWSGQSRQVG